MAIHALEASGDTESSVRTKVTNYDDGYFLPDMAVITTPQEYLRKLAGEDRSNIKRIVLGMIVDAGFDPIVADRIINCESGYNPKAKHWNEPTATRAGSWDIGLWQINDVHGMSVEDREDIYKSTEFAIKLMQSKRGLKHWVCYKG